MSSKGGADVRRIWCRRVWREKSAVKGPSGSHANSVDRKTVKRWRRLGSCQPRRSRHRPRPIERFTEFVGQRGREIGWDGVALHRNLADLGFTGTYQQVQRFLQPYRVSVSVGSWRRCAFETEPGDHSGRLRSVPGLDRRASRRRSICSP
jgi:hypothetical protein